MLTQITSWLNWACDYSCYMLGYKEEEHQLDGKLHHAGNIPLVHQRIELVAQGMMWNVPLGSTYTDERGNFLHRYKWRAHPFQRKQVLLVRLFGERLPSQDDPWTRDLEREIAKLSLVKPLDALQWSVPNLLFDTYASQETLPVLKHSSYPRQESDLTLLGSPLFPMDFPACGIDVSEPYDRVPKRNVSAESTLAILLDGPLLAELNEDTTVARISLGDGSAFPHCIVHIEKDEEQWSISSVQVGEKQALADDPEFSDMLFQVNSAALAQGILNHQSCTILPCGQAALAVEKSLYLSPLRQLLGPLLQHALLTPSKRNPQLPQCCEIFAFSGLSDESLLDALHKDLAPVDWEPKLFDEASSLYWEIVKRVVNDFFIDNEDKLQESWEEIRAFSKALSEHGNPIPNPDDWTQVKQYCARIVYLATFDNWTSSLKLAHLAHDLGRASLTPAKDWTMGPAIQQTVWAEMLLYRNPPTLLSNPKGNIYCGLVQALNEASEDFEALGCDIAQMPYGPC